ncbi:hypothetical protein MPSEU_000054300 [Mayamaea pseudoterrestris]|nr:hypothetical protein MPSEU_000054300 [Mayamaea pseudoterrestris]
MSSQGGQRNMNITPGDFVELTCEGYKGKRGYVLERPGPGQRVINHVSDASSHSLSVVIDNDYPYYVPSEARANEYLSVDREDLILLQKELVRFQVRVCDYKSSKFPCLGVAAAPSYSRQEIAFDTESVFRKMYRPSIEELPGPHTVESVFKDVETESLFRDMFKGNNLVLTWMHYFEKDTNDDIGDHLENCRPTLITHVYEAKPDGTLVELGFVGGFPKASRNHSEKAYQTRYNWLDRRLSENQLTLGQARALLERIFHLLFRLVAFDLGNYNAAAIARGMVMSYKDENRWKEAVDLEMITGDLMSVSPRKDALFFELYKISTCLDACARYREAGALYGQAIECYRNVPDNYATFPPMEIDSRLQERLWLEVIMHYQKGRAYSSCCEWELAETSLLASLRKLFKNLHGYQAFDEPLFQKTYEELISLLYAWVDSLGGDGVASPINEVANLLRAAVLSARLKPDQPEPPIFIADRYRRDPRAAKKALKKAFSAKSVSSFRSHVSSWKKIGAVANVPLDPELMLQMYRGHERANEDARNAYLRAALVVPPIYSCCFPDCCKADENSKMFNCSRCKSIDYCSKECQVAHWKAHKKDCKRIAAQLEARRAQRNDE